MKIFQHCPHSCLGLITAGFSQSSHAPLTTQGLASVFPNVFFPLALQKQLFVNESRSINGKQWLIKT